MSNKVGLMILVVGLIMFGMMSHQWSWAGVAMLLMAIFRRWVAKTVSK